MLCRLCLYDCSVEHATQLFENEDESYLTKLIAKHICLEVTKNDLISTIICQSCLQRLNALKEFLQYVEERQKAFQNNLKEVRYIEEICQVTIAEDGSPALEHNEEPLMDIKDIVVDVESHIDNAQGKDEFSSADSQASDIVTHAYSDEIDEDNVPLKSLFRKSGINRKIKQIKTNVKARNSYANTASKPKSKPATRALKIKCSDKKVKKLKTPIEGTDSAQNILTPEEDKLRDEIIAKHIRLKCEICDHPADRFKDLKSHSLKEHEKHAYVVCCNRRLYNRTRLWDHIQYHLNSELFKCTMCNKVLKSRQGLSNHYANIHTDKQNLKHACTLCDKRFAQTSYLNKHMLSHTSERTHNCEFCEKAFKSIHMLRAHISGVHDQTILYICDICGREYKSKFNFENHVAEHQGRGHERKEQCQMCKKWLRPNCLSKHIKTHNRDDVKCNLCGKQVKSEAALRGHIQYIHKMKRIYSCTYCDRTFKTSRVLKEHIGTHTGAKDYNCPHCPLEFRSNANMYSHIKKIHVEEWAKKELSRKEQSTRPPERTSL